ncbi:MAG: DUF624 domain-containing protein [Lachnospiraceae bacterium]|nr:DUF624 domain-containing protein [Lachnospiraceae bacterium]
MGSLFDTEGTLMSVLVKIADVAWLNILFLLCSIPIVTIGASTTALYYVTTKMIDGEEGYLAKSFFKSFKQNFKQSTIIWLLLLLLYVILGVDVLYLLRSGSVYTAVGIFVVMIPGFFVLFTGLYVFPVLARFENNVKNTIKNALLLSLANAPRTILMLVISVGLPALCLYNLYFLPLLFICAFSLPAYLNAALLYKIFKRITPEDTTLTEDEGIFETSQRMEKEKIGKEK